MIETQTLDEFYANGLAAAQAHFDALVACMCSVLPEGARDTIPKAMTDGGGLFSASTKEFYLLILANTPGYESISAVFEYAAAPRGDYGFTEWRFKKFSVMIGSATIFSQPHEYSATCIEDALVLSKQIAAYREKYNAEHPAIPTIPTIATAKPN